MTKKDTKLKLIRKNSEFDFIDENIEYSDDDELTGLEKPFTLSNPSPEKMAYLQNVREKNFL